MSWFRRLGRWINCHLLGSHEWTCRAEQGIKPTEMQLRGGIEGFEEYSEMYCAHCGTSSKLNSTYGKRQNTTGASHRDC